MSKNQNMNELKTWEDYNQLSQSFFEQGRLVEAIGSYRRALMLNPNLAVPSFLAQLAELSTIHIPAKQLNILPNHKITETPEGFVVSLAGNQGFVFYGPYIDIPDGLYRIQVEFDFPDSNFEPTDISTAPTGFKFDIAAPFPSIIYETEVASSQNQLNFYLDILSGQRAEFRFFSLGTAFTVKSIILALVYSPQNNLDTALNYYFDLASFFNLKDKTDKASIAYNQCVELNLSAVEIEHFLTNYHQGLVSDIEWTNACSTLGKIFQQKGKLQEAINCYRQLIQRVPHQASAYESLAILLAEQGKIQEAVTVFQKANPALQKVDIYDEIWRNLNHCSSLNDELYLNREINREKAYQYFNQKTNPYTIININGLEPESQAFLERSHISVSNLKLIQQENLALEQIYINIDDQEQTQQFSKLVQKKSDFTWELLNPKHFQQSIIETGYIYTICPLTGTVLKSNQSFYIQQHTVIPLCFYRFQSTEVFYLVVGGWSGGKVAVYFPQRELLVLLSYEWGLWLKHEEYLNSFKAHLVSNWQQVKSYISLESSTKKIASISGVIANLGHYFWNELTAIQYLDDTQLLDRVDQFILGSDSRLELHHLFPEISEDKIYKVQSKEDIFQLILRNNLFAVRLTDFRIQESLVKRIYNAATANCSQVFLQEVEQAKKHFPLLWINLRGHNKSWISQVDGYANIINELSQEYPNLAILFDGFSTEKATMEKIIQHIPSTVKIYDGLNCSIQETLVWAFAIDAYVAVIGSGLTLVTWIANKPGVAHSDRAHYSQVEMWGQVRENGINPTYIPLEYIVDIQDGREGWLNYQCDWKVIYNEIVQLIRNLDSSTHRQEKIEMDIQQQIVAPTSQDPLPLPQTDYLKLDLGCGGNKKPGTVGLDYCAIPGVVDYVLNLQTDKLPFPDRSVDYVYSAHCLEHLTESPVHLFQEISRVCVEGARLEFWTPYVWHNSAFIYGHTTYYQEDSYMHLCVWFADLWAAGLGARWYLKELVYVIEPSILVELYKQKVQLDFAIRYYKNVVHELGAIIEVCHDNRGQIIYPQRSFATNRAAQRFLLQQQSEPIDEIELTQAINWFSGSAS